MEPTKVFTWQGHDVFFDAGQEKFYAPSLFERGFESAPQIKGSIDRAMTQKRKVEKPQIALEVITGSLSSRTITGLHAGTGKMLFSQKYDDGYSSVTLYPKTATVEAMLAEKVRIRAESDRIDALLYKFQIHAGHGYATEDGGEDDRLAKAYARLENEYKQKQQASDGTTLAALVASYSPEGKRSR